jgi:small subunit ribosomal protein S16
MSVVIRLMRAGAKKRPFYRMVAADSRRQRDGRFLEILGHYNPLTQPYELVVHRDKVERWILLGAQPSEQVASLLRTLGITASPSHAVKAARAAAGIAPAPAPKAKPAAKRAVQRKSSERKVKAKAARKTGKKVAAKASPKPAAKA